MDRGFVFTIDAILSLIILVGVLSGLVYETPIDISDIQIRQAKIDLNYTCSIADCHEFASMDVNVTKLLETLS